MKTIEAISYGNFKNQILDIHLPDGDTFDVFVYFHGGGLETGSEKDDKIVFDYLTEKGIAVVSADYRRYPDAVYPEYIEDAAAVVAWAKVHMPEYGTVKNSYIGGSSAGAYLSMMLCFDKQWLKPYGIDPADLGGFIHNGGQPTAHFKVLTNRGVDSRRVIVDETAPMYHVGMDETYAPMLFVVADNDMPSRYEQTMLMVSAMKDFGHEDKVSCKIMEHFNHCGYVCAVDENGESLFGKIIDNWIKKAGK